MSNADKAARDLFAAAALSGLLAGDHVRRHRDDSDETYRENAVRAAFEWADAMMQRRATDGGGDGG